MPLDDFQKHILSLIGPHRNNKSVVAGGSMLHINGTRLSGDIDIFHPDLESRNTSTKIDFNILEQDKLYMSNFIKNDLYNEFTVFKDDNFPVTLQYGISDNPVFFPLIQEDNYVRLHTIDLSINKCCAFVDRNITRDYYDILFIHENIMPLANLIYATAGRRDFNPFSMLSFFRKKNNMVGFDFKDIENDLLVQEEPEHIKKSLNAIFEEAEETLNLLSKNIQFRENVGSLMLNENGYIYEINNGANCIFKNNYPIDDANIVQNDFLDSFIQQNLINKYHNQHVLRF